MKIGTADLTLEKPFCWRPDGYGFHYLVTPDRTLSVTWSPAAYSNNRDYTPEATREWARRAERRRKSPEYRTTDDVLSVIREQGRDSVEIAAFDKDGWVHPDEWDDDVNGWQSSEDVRRFIEWLQAPVEVS